MEERWLKLKQLHQNILSPNKKLFPDEGEGSKLAQTLTILLRLDVKSCERYPSRCLHCHQLLSLTVIKLIFDNSQYGNDNYSSFSQQLFVSLRSVLLVKCLKSNLDKFIQYSAQKVVLSALKSDFIEELDKVELLEEMVAKIDNDSSHVEFVVELLTHSMSRKNGENLNKACFSVLKKHLPKVSQSLISSPNFTNLFYNYFALLQKVVKFINKQPNDLELLDQIFRDLISELIRLFFTRTFSENQRLTSRKCLDFFNSLMCYSDKLVLQKQVNEFYVNFARKFMEGVTESDFKMDFSTINIGFMGHPVTEPQIDLPLLRRFLLINLKCFAVILKHDSGLSTEYSCDILKKLLGTFCDIINKRADGNLEWLPLVLEDQDDVYVECLICLLDINSVLTKRNPNSSILTVINPYPVFFQFLEATNYDSSVIMDWLVSPETCFLLYLSRLLKGIINDWSTFVTSAHDRYGVDCKVKETEMPQFTLVLTKADSSKSKSSKNNENLNCNKILLNTHNFGDNKQDSLPVMSVMATCGKDGLGQGHQSVLTYQNNGSNTDIELGISQTTIYDQNISDSENIANMSGGLSAIMAYSDSDDGNDTSTDLSDSRSLNFEFKINQSKPVENPITSSIQSECSVEKSCDMQCLDKVMSLFIRVRFQIERLVDQDLFPYNPAPLLSLLNQCEDLYES